MVILETFSGDWKWVQLVCLLLLNVNRSVVVQLYRGKCVQRPTASCINAFIPFDLDLKVVARVFVADGESEATCFMPFWHHLKEESMGRVQTTRQVFQYYG